MQGEILVKVLAGITGHAHLKSMEGVISLPAFIFSSGSVSRLPARPCLSLKTLFTPSVNEIFKMSKFLSLQHL